MTELIYAGPKVEKLIKQKYPQATIEDASDDIHRERFEVEIDKVSKEDFYSFAKQSGFNEVCLGFLLGELRTKEKEQINDNRKDKGNDNQKTKPH